MFYFYNLKNSQLKSKLVIIEQYFYPEGWSGAQIPRDIAIFLEKKGWHVEVICGDKQYVKDIDNIQNDPRNKSLTINRIKMPFSSKRYFLRFINQFYFSFLALFKLLNNKKISLLMVQTNPPPIVITSFLFSLLTNKPYIIISMDLYPDILFANLNEPLKSISKNFLSLLFNNSYKSADKVISLSSTMTSKLMKKGVNSENIIQISNWATGNIDVVRGKDNIFRDEWDVNANLVFIYSGNLGKAHEWKTLLFAIKKANFNPIEFKLIFVASGSKLREVKKFVDRYSLQSSVIFKNLVSPNDLPHTLGLADIAIVSLEYGFEGLVMPSKFAGYLCRGLPILYIGPDSEIKDIIVKSNCGKCFENNEVENLSNFMSKLCKDKSSLNTMSINALNYYKKYFSSEIGLEKYAKITNKYQIS